MTENKSYKRRDYEAVAGMQQYELTSTRYSGGNGLIPHQERRHPFGYKSQSILSKVSRIVIA